MSDTPAPEDRPAPPPRTQAKETRGRWPGIVWAVPVAAALIVAYLGLRAFSHAGVDVTVSFTEAADARPGDTQVVYKGLSIGRVTKVRLDRQAQRVLMTLRLNPTAKPLLHANTKFYLIGATPSLTDINSLKAAVAGVSIGVAPGGGAPARSFTGLDKTPVLAPDTAGSSFTLNADTVGNIRPGASVFYHGLEVGKVTDLDLVSPLQFRMKIFILAPYDKFVRAGTLFYQASAVQFSLSSAGISTQIAPANAAIAGGVEFDTTQEMLTQPRAHAGDVYQLYLDKGHALGAPRGAAVFYDILFTDPVGDLDVGAPVRLHGFQVGSVTARSMRFDPARGVLLTPVTVAIEPERLGLQNVTAPANGDWRSIANGAVDRLIRMGYRARLGQNPPLVGGRVVDLALASKADGVRGLVSGQEHPLIPAASSGDLTALTDKVDDILSQVQQIPIARIGSDVRSITARLSQLLDSPKVSDSVDHLDATLRQVDQITRQVQPQIGPLIAKLNTAADQAAQTAQAANAAISGDGATQDASLAGAIKELTDSARTIRSLADYLNRHPEALIRGKKGDR